MPTATRSTNGELKHIPLDSIVANPDQPRQSFDEKKLKELAASIREKGVLQPIIVRPMSQMLAPFG